MSDFQELIQQIIEFRNRRDWKQFHTPKDFAISLALETSEVLEYFQWKSEGQIKETNQVKKGRARR
jgi:NTP pyrophosphatase (non-canonical NTP hydrolase)